MKNGWQPWKTAYVEQKWWCLYIDSNILDFGMLYEFSHIPNGHSDLSHWTWVIWLFHGYSKDSADISSILGASIQAHQNAQLFNSCTGSKIQLAGKRRIAAKPIYCAPSIWDKGIQAKRLHQKLFFRSLVTILSRKCPQKYAWKICNSEQENLHVFLVNL